MIKIIWLNTQGKAFTHIPTPPKTELSVHCIEYLQREREERQESPLGHCPVKGQTRKKNTKSDSTRVNMKANQLHSLPSSQSAYLFGTILIWSVIHLFEWFISGLQHDLEN